MMDKKGPCMDHVMLMFIDFPVDSSVERSGAHEPNSALQHVIIPERKMLSINQSIWSMYGKSTMPKQENTNH